MERGQRPLERLGARQVPGDEPRRARAHPVDFILNTLPRLASDGIEIYGEEKLKTARVNRHTPTISFQVSSGINWFDLQTTVNFGELEVPLKEFRRLVYEELETIPPDEKWTGYLEAVAAYQETPLKTAAPLNGVVHPDGFDEWFQTNVYQQRQGSAQAPPRSVSGRVAGLLGPHPGAHARCQAFRCQHQLS